MQGHGVIPRVLQGFADVPAEAEYALLNCSVPSGCLHNVDLSTLTVDHDDLVRCDIRVKEGRVVDVASCRQWACSTIDLEGGCVWPTFVDLHTHIDKGHTCERSRNPTGSLKGADSSTALDANFWSLDDVFWRMDFSIRCAYAHGTSALRTHLINMVPKQLELTWPAFNKLRTKWKGRVELQGVALVTLSFFRDRDQARHLADTVRQHGGILGCAVCCSDTGGQACDEWTTCERDRDALLDFIFELAAERRLLLDFHVDENGNRESQGLRHIAQKTIQHDYHDKVVCGHCCSLAYQTPEALAETLKLAAEARVTVVSLPLVNEWTQDRSTGDANRTPRWRGITTLHELRDAGVKAAMASDNTRDQFYAYGDLDMLEVFTQGVRLGHLDRPYSDWPNAVTQHPADAMQLPEHGRIAIGGPANFVLFRARRYSELLSRPQIDRVIVRDGRQICALPPDYKLLDADPTTHEYLYQSGLPRTSFQSTCIRIPSSHLRAMRPDRVSQQLPLVRGLSQVLLDEASASPSADWGVHMAPLAAGSLHPRCVSASASAAELASAAAEGSDGGTDAPAPGWMSALEGDRALSPFEGSVPYSNGGAAAPGWQPPSWSWAATIVGSAALGSLATALCMSARRQL